jgi:hypothetical protein
VVRYASLCKIVTFSQKVRSGEVVRIIVEGFAKIFGYLCATKEVTLAACVGVQAAKAPISRRISLMITSS